MKEWGTKKYDSQKTNSNMAEVLPYHNYLKVNRLNSPSEKAETGKMDF